jgi:hypothetical protein
MTWIAPKASPYDQALEADAEIASSEVPHGGSVGSGSRATTALSLAVAEALRKRISVARPLLQSLQS